MKPLPRANAIIVTFVAALGAGCAPIPDRGPIDARAYLESAAPRPEDRAEAVSIQPIGLRKGAERTLLLDVVLEGPPAATEKAALFVRSGIFFEPARWLDIVNPDGRHLTLVAAEEATMPGGTGLRLAPEYRLQRDVTTVRLLLACRFGTRTPLRGGVYRVRLDESTVGSEVRSMVDCPLLIVGGWQELELFRGKLREKGLSEGGLGGSEVGLR